MDPLEAKSAANGHHLVEEELKRPELWVVGAVRAAAAQLVVEDDAAAALGEALERLEVVVRGSRTAVEAQEYDAALRADVAVPGLVAAKGDAPFGFPHRISGSRRAG
jgi:hypothetical protein